MPTKTGPITSLPAASEQHMLLLFMPLKKGMLEAAMHGTRTAVAAVNAARSKGIDPRVATGVHFAMFYGLPADTQPQPALPVPSFKTARGKDLLVVQSIYDADFGPYISAFTTNPAIAQGLDAVLGAMDETRIVKPTDPTSAAFILAHGGVAKNNTAFLKLLMRYNFADPTIPAAAAFPVNTPANPRYLLVGTFPGLTVGNILQNYPNAGAQWPLPAPQIKFAPAAPPVG
jgi:hypothetical protein